MQELGSEILKIAYHDARDTAGLPRIDERELKVGRMLAINATDAKDRLPATILLQVVYTSTHDRYRYTIFQYCGAIGTPFHFYGSFGPAGDAQPTQIPESSLVKKGSCGWLVPRQRLNMIYCGGGIEVGGRDLMLEYVNGGPKFVVVHKVIGVGIFEVQEGYRPPDVQLYLDYLKNAAREEKERLARL